MKEKLVKIIIDPPIECIELSKTNTNIQVFAFRGEKHVGMIVYQHGRGWITYRGGDSNGYIPVSNREECIRRGMEGYGFKYYTERPPASI